MGPLSGFTLPSQGGGRYSGNISNPIANLDTNAFAQNIANINHYNDVSNGRNVNYSSPQDIAAAIQNLNKFSNTTDQVKILAKAGAMGLIDRNKSAQAINQIINNNTAQSQQNFQNSLNPFERSVMFLHDAGSGIINSGIDLGKMVVAAPAMGAADTLGFIPGLSKGAAKAQRDIRNFAFGTQNDSQIAQKILGNTLTAGSLLVGAPEASAVLKGGMPGLKAAGTLAFGGALGGEGSALQTGNASLKDQLINTLAGAALGELPVAGKALKEGITAGLSKAAPTVDKSIISAAESAGKMPHGAATAIDTSKVDFSKLPRNLEADQQAQQILKSGGSQDAAMKVYMDKGATLGDAAAQVQRVMKDSGMAATGAHPLNPVTMSIPEVQAGDHSQAILNQKYLRGKYGDFAEQAQTAAKGMTPHDIQLLDYYEKKPIGYVMQKADNPQQVQKVLSIIKQGYDFRQATDSALGLDVGYRKNYLQHYFDLSSPEAQQKFEDYAVKNVPNYKPGYGNARVFENYGQAKAAGFDRLHENILQDFQHSMSAAQTNHGRLALVKGLHEAFPGKVAVGEILRDTNTGKSYKQLTVPGGNSVSMPAEIADKINARANATNPKGPLGLYDKANAFVKYVELGGGTFHAVTTAGTHLGQQLTSGELFKHPLDTLRVIGGTASKSTHAKIMDHYRANGTLDNALKSGVTLMPKDILGDANSGLYDKLKNGKFNPIAQIHDAVFQRQIPLAKLSIFEQETKGLNPNVPADLAKMRQVASAVNNFGGINRAVEGMTPQTAKLLSRAVLATDFTETKFRVLFNAFARGGEQGKIARQMVIGKTLVMAAPGMIALAAQGKIDPKDPNSIGKAFVQQILDPSIPTGFKTPSGVPKSAKLPATFISEIGRIFMPMFDSANLDKASGIEQYASGRLAALPAALEEAFTNKDYYGNPIVAQNANGSTDLLGTAGNILASKGPIPIQQAIKVARGQETPTEAAINTAGLRVTADANTPEGQKQAAQSDFYNVYNNATVQHDALVRKISSALYGANASPARAQRMADQWNSQVDSQFAPIFQKYGNTGQLQPYFKDNVDRLKINIKVSKAGRPYVKH